MKLRTIVPDSAVSSYVHEIIVMEDDRLAQDMTIPLVARDYPGIVEPGRKFGIETIIPYFEDCACGFSNVNIKELFW